MRGRGAGVRLIGCFLDCAAMLDVSESLGRCAISFRAVDVRELFSIR